MSQRMKLRDSIRPPTRFGELESEDPTATLLQSMRQARADGCDKDRNLVEFANVTSEVVLRQRAPKPKRQIVPFDPTLPPAAFPSITGLRPSDPKSGKENGAIGQSRAFGVNNGERDVEMAAVEDGIPLGAIENYAASNTAVNPVYVKNMNAMAASVQCDNGFTCNLSDSDLEEPVDDSVKLGAKVPNPKWSDIVPSLQVEIVENLLRESDWRKVCSKLDLKKDDRERIVRYLNTRNRQILRENKRLDEMRQKQLRALMRIDNSDIKRNNVPHQLVLRRITRKTTSRILGNLPNDLLMCQAADVLAARQYLHRRSLDRSLAGDWGHSLVLLREPEDTNGLDPERFEWQENLNLGLELLESESLKKGSEDIDIKPKREHILGIGRRSTVNPVDLTRRPHETSPVRDWCHQFPFRYSEWEPIPPKPPKQTHQSNKIVCLNVGVEKAAQIRELQESGASIMHVPSAQLSSPLVAPVETPSKVYYGPITQEESDAEVSLAFRNRETKPIVRSLGGTWSMNVLDPSVSQARYTSKIKKAKFEADELRLRGQEEEATRQTTGLLSPPQRALAFLLNQPPSFSLKPGFVDEILARYERLPGLDDMLLPAQSRNEEATLQELDVRYDAFLDFERTTTHLEDGTMDVGDFMDTCDDGEDGDGEMVRVPVP